MSLQNKVRYNKKLWEWTKASGVIFMFLVFLGTYIYFVNKASTLGYFYRQEKAKRDAMEFDYNIESFETTKIYQNLRQNAMTGNRYLNANSTEFSLNDNLYKVNP